MSAPWSSFAFFCLKYLSELLRRAFVPRVTIAAACEGCGSRLLSSTRVESLSLAWSRTNWTCSMWRHQLAQTPISPSFSSTQSSRTVTLHAETNLNEVLLLDPKYFFKAGNLGCRLHLPHVPSDASHTQISRTMLSSISLPSHTIATRA